MHYIPHQRLWLIAATFLATTCVVQNSRANEPPTDLCSLLPASEVSKTLGRAYNSPEKSVAPRPYANTVQGSDCNYRSKDGRTNVQFRTYVDPSASEATALFDKLARFYSPNRPVPGLADQAYFDRRHGLHVRNGKVRFFLSLDPSDDVTPAQEKQIKDLAAQVVGQL